MSAGQFLFGRLPRKDSRCASGTNRQRLRRELHPNQRAVAKSLHSFDYVSCRIGKILRETTGGSRRADYSTNSEQISSGAAVSERICCCTLQERGYFAFGCRLRVSRRLQYFPTNSPQLQAQRSRESARLREELYPLLPA